MIAARRHDFVWVDPTAFGGNAALRDWSSAGHPFVQRSGLAPSGTVLLGWSRPPDCAPRRHAFCVPASAVFRRTRPPHLSDAVSAAPASWSDQVNRLLAAAVRWHLDLRVYGSLAWAFTSGLGYLSQSSDIDLLIEGRTGPVGVEQIAFLRGFQSHCRPRIDGEIVFASGDAVSWREMLAAPRDVLVRGLEGPRLAPLASVTG